jgi:hypothetical protein
LLETESGKVCGKYCPAKFANEKVDIVCGLNQNESVKKRTEVVCRKTESGKRN